jgi:hypothetical protein
LKKRKEEEEVRVMGKEMDLRFINLIILSSPTFFLFTLLLLAFAYQGKDIVFKFIIE